MTQLEISDITIEDSDDNLAKIRIHVGGEMFFDSPPLPKEVAEGVKKNLTNRTEPKESSGMYG